jgi:hypothetical protein
MGYADPTFDENDPMTMEPTLPDGSLTDLEIAALMDSPEFQAQMAAMTQQAAAQLAALVASLRAVEQQLPSPPPPDSDPWGDDLPVGISLPPPEPVLLPPDGAKPALEPIDAPLPDPQPFDRAAVMPVYDELAFDMLAVLPQPVAPEPIFVGAAPVEPAPSPGGAWQWATEEHGQTGGEGGLF